MRLLESRIPHRSPFLDHLLAMQKLADEGEPELAVIGAAMAIETHLSTFVPWRTMFNPAGRTEKRSYR
jgi:hypothetical protein